ncbi:uncharacterized protein EV154DRAFT_6729 [Mucor mucedo]|uniref:uncharacterized protein n=1 Tax=Mucor mucedo TaxID=29922 RepID=UPI00221F23E7|nr:uncharacterized protein EV154DRAFT_6729 [Mucor mucedo]KAI7895482.1 hypothetical protein EV154DRAFT_6729 [Mucor mucedo]
MLPMWSIEDHANTGPVLFGIWYERYRQTYGEFNETSRNLKKPQYNYLIWNSIIDKSRRRKRLKSSYHEGALDLLIEAQRSATDEGRRLLNPGTVAFHSTDSGEITVDGNAHKWLIGPIEGHSVGSAIYSLRTPSPRFLGPRFDIADKGDSSSETTQISAENHETDVSLGLLYKPIDDQASELTFYRRFAMLLQTLFLMILI